MEAPLDLYGASREELIRRIVRQREQIAELEQRVVRQEAELAALRATLTQLTERIGALLAGLDPPPSADPSGSPGTMPGLKPGPPHPTPPPRRPRKHRARGYGRKRMPPTARQVHAFRHCPQCGAPLRGGTHRREV